MINVVVVDDDGITLEYICKFVRDNLNLDKKIVSYTSSTLFFYEMSCIQPHIVLLDIDMPDMNGFELAELLKSVNPNVVVIFISNLEHMVFDAFAIDAFYFVRKSSLDNDLDRALKCYEKKFQASEKLFYFKTIDAVYSIALGDILFFETIGHEIILHAVNQKQYRLKREKENRIKMISEQLAEDGFIRVHKSYLVNFRYIHLIKRAEVILKNGISIQINPKNVSEIRRLYQKFLMRGANV